VSRAFCVEKNSAAPDVTILGDDSTTATLVVPYVEFVLTEVLKNSLQVRLGRQHDCMCVLGGEGGGGKHVNGCKKQCGHSQAELAKES